MIERVFKAKRIDNGEWVEGALFIGENYCVFGQQIKFSPDISTECKIVGYRVDRNTICQCTGMTTNSGQKVWENDVIQHHYGMDKAAIKFGSYQSEMDTRATAHCGFYVDWGKNLYRKDLGYWLMMGVEIVGNCIDNPDLLNDAID